MGKTAIGAIAALSFLIPNTQRLLKEHISGPKLTIGMGKVTVLVLAFAFQKSPAQLSLPQIWRAVNLIE
jgi:hypothetical protein